MLRGAPADGQTRFVLLEDFSVFPPNLSVVTPSQAQVLLSVF